jgi:hypothetical protein
VLQFSDYIRDFFVSKREFLLGMLENPNLLEYESFSEQLWAVFHLAEELAYMIELARLPDADYRHVSTDSKRAYSALIVEWLKHMEHLRNRYLISSPWRCEQTRLTQRPRRSSPTKTDACSSAQV